MMVDRKAYWRLFGADDGVDKQSMRIEMETKELCQHPLGPRYHRPGRERNKNKRIG